MDWGGVWTLAVCKGRLLHSPLTLRTGFDICRGLEFFSKYGSNIRAITDMLFKPVNEKQYIADIREDTENFADRSSGITPDLQNLNHQSNHSSKIFVIKPGPTPQTTCLTIPTSFLQKAPSRKAAAKRHEALCCLAITRLFVALQDGFSNTLLTSYSPT